MKSQPDWKPIFLGTVSLLAGIILILIYAATLPTRDIVSILAGAIFVMLGDSYIWRELDRFWQRKRQEQELKDIKTQKKNE